MFKQNIFKKFFRNSSKSSSSINSSREALIEGFNEKSIAQGTIEYLVILAVVIVISLIVVGLFVTVFDSPSQQITDSSAQIGNVATGGISIVEAVIDYEGDSLIRLTNNSSDALTLTRISVGGVNNDFSEQIVGSDSKTFSLSNLSSGCVCLSGQKSVTCEYVISYIQNGLLKNDRSYKSITCVSSSQPSISNVVVGLGDGSLTNPWIINSCLELQDVSERLDGNYKLGVNIDCSDTINWNGGAGFVPIGNDPNEFFGSFNGNNKTINNLYIYRPTLTSIGLFGEAINAEIFDLGLIDSNVTGKDFVGGIAGYLGTSTITNSYTTGSVRGLSTGLYIGGIAGYANLSSMIVDSHNDGNVRGIQYVGGVSGGVGYSELLRTYNSGAIYGTSRIGGISGIHDHGSIINQSYNYGGITSTSTYAGGITGYLVDSSAINNSYNIGDVNAISGTRGYVGGIAGLVYSGSTITNCYNTGTISGVNTIGGLTSSSQGTNSNVKNSFSVGKVYGGAEGAVEAVLTGGTATNIWWFNQAGDSATDCGAGGSCHTALSESAFYSSNSPDQNVYVGSTPWDFTTIWQIQEGVSYPTLAWQ